jgi:hypothetical protein
VARTRGVAYATLRGRGTPPYARSRLRDSARAGHAPVRAESLTRLCAGGVRPKAGPLERAPVRDAALAPGGHGAGRLAPPLAAFPAQRVGRTALRSRTRHTTGDTYVSRRFPCATVGGRPSAGPDKASL